MGTAPQAAKNKIGFIPDRPYLYEKLTGMEFLKFTADLYNVAESVFKAAAVKNLELFQIPCGKRSYGRNGETEKQAGNPRAVGQSHRIRSPGG